MNSTHVNVEKVIVAKTSDQKSFCTLKLTTGEAVNGAVMSEIANDVPTSVNKL